MNYGRYQILREMGRGSMGVVFQARDPHIDRLLAVKVLRTDRLESDDLIQRFLKEAKVIGRLTHPNIVTIYDVGEEQGTVYIAMEFREGKSLAEMVRGKLDNEEIVAIGVQLAETLHYAHQKGVVHRDVKPSNIIVQAGGQVKITDFGIAHVDDSAAALRTRAGEIMGTPAYMSPEQVLGKAVDGRSDIFSLGIILYEMATGRRPFGGESKSLVAVFHDIVQLAPQEPADATAGIPMELSRLIMKALDKEPANRFQTGRELAEALKLSLWDPASARAQQAKLLAHQGRARERLAWGVAPALLALAVGCYYYYFRYREATASAPAAVIEVSPEQDRGRDMVVKPDPASKARREAALPWANGRGLVQPKPVPGTGRLDSPAAAR